MSERWLVLDAAAAVARVGHVEDGVVIASAESTVRAAHGEALLPLVDQVLAPRGVLGLAGIVCGVGPGSFTGIRVALATALGLRRALGIPVVTVSTFECLALGADAGRTWMVVPALPGEVYGEPWAHGAPVGDAQLAPPETLDGPQRTADVSLDDLWRASRGKSPSNELVPRYVAPPRITLPKR